MEHVFTVQGMRCGHCEKAIRQAIAAIDPQAEVVIDRAAERVQVRSDTAADPLAQAIREEGYTVG
jgi:copper chaperone